MVEHLLAKEDVASSSLVTRSSLRLERSGKRKLKRETAISFRSEQKAIRFEKYLKSSSGREFARRYF